MGACDPDSLGSLRLVLDAYRKKWAGETTHDLPHRARGIIPGIFLNIDLQKLLQKLLYGAIQFPLGAVGSQADDHLSAVKEALQVIPVIVNLIYIKDHHTRQFNSLIITHKKIITIAHSIIRNLNNVPQNYNSLSSGSTSISSIRLNTRVS